MPGIFDDRITRPVNRMDAERAREENVQRKKSKRPTCWG